MNRKTLGARGASGVRAAFADAAAKRAREDDRPDPPAIFSRVVRVGKRQEEVTAGGWDGAPCDKLPPDCPVVPLGVDGATSYFVDTLGQMIGIPKWDQNALVKLFRTTPNYVEWAWPRWSASKGDKSPKINGVETVAAYRCLEKAAARKGLFTPTDRVRGRGAWEDGYGRLIWHSGDQLWTIEDGKLKASPPGEIDNIFYSSRPQTIEPWPERVTIADSPARAIFKALQSWSWERPVLDPLIVLGAIANLMMGGALLWRPHLFVSGDMKVGKSELQKLVKAVLGSVLHDTANTTEAGVRQRLGLDSLPIAVDEMEASGDNRRVTGILELACISSSGGQVIRGGADHRGVTHLARSSFFMTGIIPPPMRPQDRSRFAMLHLGKLSAPGDPPEVDAAAGRMILRQIMDGWSDYARMLADWRSSLQLAGLDGRAGQTYGTLLAFAQLMLGDQALEDAGVPITEAARLGELVAGATYDERAEQRENWQACLEHLLGSIVDAWKGGERPSVGSVIANYEDDQVSSLDYANERLAAAGLKLLEEPDSELPHGHRRLMLCVPRSSPAVARLFQGTRWQDGAWWLALRQGLASGVVVKPKNVKINRVTSYCLRVDLRRYDDLEREG